jgi:hypothetical protein
VLRDTPGQPRARQGYAHLLLAWGKMEDGIQELRTYVAEDRDENSFLDGAKGYADEVEDFVKKDIHAREFLVAHREAYVEMFNNYEGEQAKLGWIAEAARMMRNAEGKVVPSIPEGARPYAAVRVDLVDPKTSQLGQVGDQPFVVALADYQALARAPVSFVWRGHPFTVRVSSQAPWDQMPISVYFSRPGALDALDAVIGDWYTAGFDGRFGEPDGQRFHYISDPDPKRGGRGVTYDVDLGRARTEAIDDLLRRLSVLHGDHPIDQVLIGRGYLP